MKLVFLLLLSTSVLFAQEEASGWKVMPSVSVTTAFSLDNGRQYYDIQPLIFPPVQPFPYYDDNEFSSTGVMFGARFLNADFEPLAITLSAGANWYHRRDDDMMRPPIVYGGPPDSTPYPTPRLGLMHDGIYGGDGRSFVGFPVSLGAQILFPYEKIDKLMFFVGAEGNLHFMSRRAFSRRRVEGGFSLTAGIAVKMIEAGIRYSHFARMNSIGVQLGIRFNQFSLE